MCNSWSDDVEWWETVPPQEGCTRFRVFYPDEYEIVPRVIADVLGHSEHGAFGPGAQPPAAPTTIESVGEVHYLWPEGHPVEALLADRLQGPEAAVAPDGGRTGDVRDRMVVTEHSTQHDDLEPRTRRAVDEEMAVSLHEKGGRYEVRSASGNWYEVDVISESCTCPDWQKRTPEGSCKHIRRNEIGGTPPAGSTRSRADRTTPLRQISAPSAAVTATQPPATKPPRKQPPSVEG